jgi:hypothetical protein
LKDVAPREEKATPTPKAGRSIATEAVMRSAVPSVEPAEVEPRTVGLAVVCVVRISPYWVV